MAPTTNIGSATPITLNEEEKAGELTTNQKKAINDAVAKIRALAERRGRNADWAEQAVREAANVTASQAVQLHAVDFIASDVNDLLAKTDGRQVEVRGQTMTLRTANAAVETYDMSFFERVLQTVSDPNIAYILLSLGSLALIFELANPGLIFPGVLGGLMLVTGFYSLGTLDGNWSGLALIAFAFLLFAVDAFVQSHGTLTLGGVGAFLFGSLLLSNSQDGQVLHLSRALVLAVTLLLAVFFGLIVFFAARVRGKPPSTGVSTLLGMTAEVRKDLDPVGMVYLYGELWEAVSPAGFIPRGTRVTVTALQGMRLTVEPLGAAAPDGALVQGQP
jgi:membrane-bound serine protease (ClpP class)